MRVWATAWDVFGLAPSRVGHGRQEAAHFVVCFGWGVFFRFFYFFFLERTRSTASTRPRCLMYLSTNTDHMPGQQYGLLVITHIQQRRAGISF